jgi:hypothetical protein
MFNLLLNGVKTYMLKLTDLRSINELLFIRMRPMYHRLSEVAGLWKAISEAVAARLISTKLITVFCHVCFRDASELLMMQQVVLPSRPVLHVRDKERPRSSRTPERVGFFTSLPPDWLNLLYSFA